MRELVRLLEQRFNRTGWTLTRPQHGHRKECYIAQAGDLKLFVKFRIGNAGPVWQLGELKVAPRILSIGSWGGKTFLIQKFIEGENPTPAWFSDHLDYLASFIRRYHDAEFLTRALFTRRTYAELVARDLAGLKTRFKRLKASGKFDLSEIEADFAKLKLDGLSLKPVELVPVHAEPNTSNMLIKDGQLYMIDWDEIRLGDPMQDVGLILWWYVPPLHWAEFFKSYGLTPDDEVLRRIFWWAAKSSLSIALWQFEHGFDGRAFLRDFQAAVNGRPNPRADY